MEAEMTCGICLELFNVPLMLSCGHNFCKGCIEGILSSRLSGRPHRYQRGEFSTLDCPLCQRKIVLEKGIDGIPLNRTLNNIIACHKGKSQTNYSDASWHTDQDLPESKCFQHDLPMLFYCLDCDLPVCKSCDCYRKSVAVLFVGESLSGKPHRCREIKEHAISLQTSIASTLTELKQKVMPINGCIQVMEDIIHGINENEKKVERQLDMEITALISMLKSRQEELKRTLGNDIRELQQPIQDKLAKYKAMITNIQEHFKKLSMVKGTKNVSLRIKLMQDSQKQLTQLLKCDISLSKTDIPAVNMLKWTLPKKHLEDSISHLEWYKISQQRETKDQDSSKQKVTQNIFMPSFNQKETTLTNKDGRTILQPKRSGSVGPDMVFGQQKTTPAAASFLDMNTQASVTPVRRFSTPAVTDDNVTSAETSAFMIPPVFTQFNKKPTSPFTTGATDNAGAISFGASNVKKDGSSVSGGGQGGALNLSTNKPLNLSINTRPGAKLFRSDSQNSRSPTTPSDTGTNIFGHFDNIISTLNTLAISFAPKNPVVSATTTQGVPGSPIASVPVSSTSAAEASSPSWNWQLQNQRVTGDTTPDTRVPVSSNGTANIPTASSSDTQNQLLAANSASGANFLSNIISVPVSKDVSSLPSGFSNLSVGTTGIGQVPPRLIKDGEKKMVSSAILKMDQSQKAGSGFIHPDGAALFRFGSPVNVNSVQAPVKSGFSASGFTPIDPQAPSHQNTVANFVYPSNPNTSILTTANFVMPSTVSASQPVSSAAATKPTVSQRLAAIPKQVPVSSSGMTLPSENNAANSNADAEQNRRFVRAERKTKEGNNHQSSSESSIVSALTGGKPSLVECHQGSGEPNLEKTGSTMSGFNFGLKSASTRDFSPNRGDITGNRASPKRNKHK